MTAEEIEQSKLAIERERLELERERHEVERDKFEQTKGFIAKHTAILIPAIVSIAAVFVTAGQVWITKMSKDKELEITSIQKRAELDAQIAQRKRELDISAARFITDNRQGIFGGTQEEQEVYAMLISILYPVEVSTPLLKRLEKGSPPETKAAWQRALETSASGAAAFSPDGKRFLTRQQGGVQLWDAETGNLIASVPSETDVTEVAFSPEGKTIALTTPRGVLIWDAVTGTVIKHVSY